MPDGPERPVDGSRRLRWAVVATLAAVVASPWVHGATYGTDARSGTIALLALGVSGPLLVPSLLTLVQLRRGATVTFAPVPLAVASGLTAFTVLVLSAALEIGVLLGFVTIPLAAAFTAVSWTRLPIRWVWRNRLTFVLGAAVVPLVATLASQLDHGRSVVISGSCLGAVLGSIVLLRRTGGGSA